MAQANREGNPMHPSDALPRYHQGMRAMEAGRDVLLDVATAQHNVALFEQAGKLTRELDATRRMLRQHALDLGYPAMAEHLFPVQPTELA